MFARTRIMRMSLMATSVLLAMAACADGDATDDEVSAQGNTTSLASDTNWPDGEEITLVIPYGPGGSFDPIGRLYGEMLSEELDTTVVVENREGGSATIGTQYVLDSEPTGYTLGVGSGNAAAFQPYVNDDLSYDSVEDLLPIVKLGAAIEVLGTQPDAPWADFEEFIAYARENPGEVTVGVSGRMAQTDLLLHQIMNELDVELVSVPSTGGGGDSMLELLGGRIDAIITSSSGAKGQVEAGEVRLLAVGGTEETELFPGVPPLGDYIGEPVELLYFVFGPLGIPDDVYDVIVEASLNVVQSDEFEQFCAENGFVYDPVGPEELMEQLKEVESAYGELVPLFQ